MKQIAKATSTLSVVALIAALILSLINNLTDPYISAIKAKKEKNALLKVLPGYTVDPEKDKTVLKINNKKFTYWTAKKTENEQTSIGYAFIAEKPGYSGKIQTMVGIDSNLKLQGISILNQTETPGLGARSEEIASKMTFWAYLTGKEVKDEPTIPWFQDQFTGLDTSKNIEVVNQGDFNSSMRKELLEKNAISTITGATITTKAVRDSISAGIKIIKPIVKENTPSNSLEEK